MNLIRHGNVIINLDNILFIVTEYSEKEEKWKVFLSDNSDKEICFDFDSEELAQRFMDKFECIDFNFLEEELKW